MKIRIKFSKSGLMCYIGHLDLMRCFQKVFVRSGIDISFTEGMSPHMIMSFASPLGVGLSGDGEYVDIEIGKRISSAEAIRSLNDQMPEGIEVTGFVEIEPGKASKAMSLVAAADYTVRIAGMDLFPGSWEDEISSFLSSGPVMVDKETKSGTKTVDIAPMIYEMRLIRGEKDCLWMRLASGSSANLRPETVVNAFLSRQGICLDETDLFIRRRELYAKGTEGNFVTLLSLGREIGEESVKTT